MRITIGIKIFAIAGLVILLMSGAALWTTWKLRNVTEQMDAVALYLLPLVDSVGKAQAQLFRQEVVLQRILKDIQNVAFAQMVSDNLDQFNALGAQADVEIEKASALAEAAVPLLERDQAVRLSRLNARMQNLEQQHQDIVALVARTMQNLKDRNPGGALALAQSFSQAQVQFNETVSAVVAETVAFSEEVTRNTEREEHLVLRFSLFVTAFAMLLGLLFAYLLTKSLVQPVRTLRDRTLAVVGGDARDDIPITSSDEIADLTRAFNDMLHGLRARDRLKSMFGQYVDPRVVDDMLAADEATSSLAAGDKRQVTVLFSDVVGFTAIGERLSPVGLVRLMNAYLSLASAPIMENEGVIDKYVGDMIMAFWCTPFILEGQQARLACHAALAQTQQLKTLKDRLPDITGLRKDLPDVDVRIGLASGEAVVGSIGSERVKNFTVMGDMVNLGARLEGANTVYGTRILICERTRVLAGDAIEAREIDIIAVKGKTETLRVFELLSEAGALSETDMEARTTFEAGLAAYRKQDWPAAQSAFEACLTIWPNDSPSRVFLERIANLRATRLNADWDSVWRLTSK